MKVIIAVGITETLIILFSKIYAITFNNSKMTVKDVNHLVKEYCRRGFTLQF